MTLFQSLDIQVNTVTPNLFCASETENGANNKSVVPKAMPFLDFMLLSQLF